MKAYRRSPTNDLHYKQGGEKEVVFEKLTHSQ